MKPVLRRLVLPPISEPVLEPSRPMPGQPVRRPAARARRPPVSAPIAVADRARRTTTPDGTTSASAPAVPTPPRLLERVRIALRTRHYSVRTEKAHVAWIRRFILFHGKRHPDALAEPEIAAFLSSLADPGRVSASTQNQALAALLFLYGEVLGRELAWMGDLVHAKRPQRLPVVLTREECHALLARLTSPYRIVGGLLYGGGLRLLEALHLRVKDVDLERCEILVRDGKGRKDRHTVLPDALIPALRQHLAAVRAQHDRDLAAGPHHGSVELPDALCRKFPSAPREWIWQWIFPASRTYLHAVTGETRRHHLHESAVQRAVAAAARTAAIPKPATPHTLRHPTCSKTATTSAPSRSSWATRTSAPR